MAWTTLKSDTLIENEYVTLKKNKVKLKDDSVIEDFYTVTIPDASLIVAVTCDNKVVLKKEYRYACGEDVIECPAGMIETGEQPYEAAQRELLEETGYKSDDWQYLGYTWESTSKLTNKMHLFLAKNCIKIRGQNLDKNERIEMICVDRVEAVQMVMDGRINANSSAHAILKVEKLI